MTKPIRIQIKRTAGFKLPDVLLEVANAETRKITKRELNQFCRDGEKDFRKKHNYPK